MLQHANIGIKMRRCKINWSRKLVIQKFFVILQRFSRKVGAGESPDIISFFKKGIYY